MADKSTTKQWLYSIRAMCRRKQTILYEISGIKAERETIYDTSHALFGKDAEGATKPSNISNPTMKKALKLCDELAVKLDALLFEMERLNLEIDVARNHINKCFEDGGITVQEYEVIFYYYFESMSNPLIVEYGYHVDVAGREEERTQQILAAYKDMLEVAEQEEIPETPTAPPAVTIKPAEEAVAALKDMEDNFKKNLELLKKYIG